VTWTTGYENSVHFLSGWNRRKINIVDVDARIQFSVFQYIPLHSNFHITWTLLYDNIVFAWKVLAAPVYDWLCLQWDLKADEDTITGICMTT
jgi:hypothetical protein